MSTEKTEEPTPQKLQKLRQRGEIPISRRFNQLHGTLLGAVSIYLVASRLPATFRALFERASESTSSIDTLQLAGIAACTTILTVGWGVAIGGSCAGLIQSKGLFVLTRIRPDGKRLKPGQVWKNRLNKQAVGNGVWVLMWTVLALLLGGFVLDQITDITAGMNINIHRFHRPETAIPLFVHPLSTLLGGWALLALSAGAFDLWWQRGSFRRRHRMSLKDIEREYREQEGDPQLKANRQELHRELIATPPTSTLANACVMVRNPVHVVVALSYDPDDIDAPVVVASGCGAVARKYLRIGRALQIPEFTDPPTARSLRNIEVGQPVPEELFEPLAVIFRWLEGPLEHQPFSYQASATD